MKKDEGFKLNLELVKEKNNEEAIRIENQFREKVEKEERQRKNKRLDY